MLHRWSSAYVNSPISSERLKTMLAQRIFQDSSHSRTFDGHVHLPGIAFEIYGRVHEGLAF